MIIKCTEEEKKYILICKCPFSFVSENKHNVCERNKDHNAECEKCFEIQGIKFEIAEDK